MTSLQDLAAGRAVQVITLEEAIRTQQAAELLNVSRPYLVKLVESGALPHRKVGPRRQLHLEDVLTYQARLDMQRHAALQALADDLQAGPRSTLFDASVLYPSLTRNLLIHLATSGLVAARWTEQIQDEWTRNLLQDRLELTP